jgi:CRP-like cAMP-binding protein
MGQAGEVTFNPPNIEMLRHSPLAAGLSDAQCSILGHAIQVRQLGDGEVLLQEGRCDGNLHVVVTGTLLVTKTNNMSEEALAVLHEGSLVGAMGFVDGLEHSASVHAIGQTQIFTLERQRMEAMLMTHPQIVYQIMRTVVRAVHSIVRTMNNHYVQLSNYVSKTNGRY